MTETQKQNQLPLPIDKPYHVSSDQLVGLTLRVSSANRWPRHKQPILCLLLKMQKGTRVQPCRDSEWDVDACLNYEDIQEFLRGLREVDPDYQRTIAGLTRIKDPDRKAHWDSINARRNDWRK